MGASNNGKGSHAALSVWQEVLQEDRHFDADQLGCAHPEVILRGLLLRDVGPFKGYIGDIMGYQNSKGSGWLLKRNSFEGYIGPYIKGLLGIYRGTLLADTTQESMRSLFDKVCVYGSAKY